ncbi:hypothetical protein L208DRAFT_1382713 [Tricholoma matsutake]|nr:hypothetical protein L208DRAFT_1382713 [Tricholoma matsutake 945]
MGPAICMVAGWDKHRRRGQEDRGGIGVVPVMLVMFCSWLERWLKLGAGESEDGWCLRLELAQEMEVERICSSWSRWEGAWETWQEIMGKWALGDRGDGALWIWFPLIRESMGQKEGGDMAMETIHWACHWVSYLRIAWL